MIPYLPMAQEYQRLPLSAHSPAQQKQSAFPRVQHAIMHSRPSGSWMSNATYILIGDSLDRRLIEQQCVINRAKQTTLQHLVATTPSCATCKQCLLPGKSRLVNIMMFGLGVDDCWQRAHWMTEYELQNRHPIARLTSFLPPVLAHVAPQSSRLIVTVHSGLWDLYASYRPDGTPEQIHRCNGTASFAAHQFINGAWSQAAAGFLHEVRRLLIPYQAKVHSLSWRTLPWINVAGEDRVALDTATASATTAQFACREGIVLRDWHRMSCSMSSRDFAEDNIHPKDFRRFADLELAEDACTSAANLSRHLCACGMPPGCVARFTPRANPIAGSRRTC